MSDQTDRAKALIEDLKEYNPKLLKSMKNPLKELEKFLEDVEKRKLETLEVMKERIPAGLDPLEYQQELNWKRQQAEEIANAEINSLLRT